MSGIFGATVIKGTRITDFTNTSASVGNVIPWGVGRFVAPGNVIWAPLPPKEQRKVVRQGKGGVKQETFTYTLSYSIAFTKGPIYGYWWIKRNGKIVYTRDPNAPAEDKQYAAKWLQRATLYNGGEDQLPDSTIESYEGMGQVTAHKDISSIVLEDDDVTNEGGAVPSYEACVIATPPEAYLTSKPYAQLFTAVAGTSAGIGGVTLRDLLLENRVQDESTESAFAQGAAQLREVDTLAIADYSESGLAHSAGTMKDAPSVTSETEKASSALIHSAGVMFNPPTGTIKVDETVSGLSQSLATLVEVITTGSTWSTIDHASGYVLSSANKTAQRGSYGWGMIRGTRKVSSGKVYLEYFIDSNDGNDLMLGMDSGSGSLSSYPGGSSGGYGYYCRGNYYGGSGSGPTYTTGDVISFAYDASSGKIWTAKNGVWIGDPAAGTGAPFTSVVTGQYAAMGAYPSGAKVTLRTVDSEFTYSPPTGFSQFG